MGGAVSTGEDNDDLIDNLIGADYIKSPEVERIFRAIDRADYFTISYKDSAYKDLAWKDGNLHISAPCIYSEVMERLNLKPGLSFLNMGSGTGYLSTMVGLSLGAQGVNHGIEIYPEVVEYANSRLEYFKKHSFALDQYEFCSPEYVVGNCLCLPLDYARRYDRIYCGAACPDGQKEYVKNLLKIGGVLVMPMNDQLEQIERVSETEWKDNQVLSVSFATLITPEKNADLVALPTIEPQKLQDVCRSVIRSLLRSIIESDHPQLKSQPQRTNKRKAKKRPMSRVVIPIVQHVHDSDSHASGDEEGNEGDSMSSSSSISELEDHTESRTAAAICYELRAMERRRRRVARSAMIRAVLQQVAQPPVPECTTSRPDAEEMTEPPPLVQEESPAESSDAHIATEEEIEQPKAPSTRKSTRETTDSGVGDEIVEMQRNEANSSETEELGAEGGGSGTKADLQSRKMELDSDSDFDEDDPTDEDRDSKEDSSGKEDPIDLLNELEKRLKPTPRPQRTLARFRKTRQSGSSSYAVLKKFARDDEASNDGANTSSDRDEAEQQPQQPKVGQLYTQYMKEKIQQLPLPLSLRLYLNYYRQF